MKCYMNRENYLKYQVEDLDEEIKYIERRLNTKGYFKPSRLCKEVLNAKLKDLQEIKNGKSIDEVLDNK